MSESLHPEELITSITLIRHGHTNETETGKLYTDPTALLTERGIEQAEKAALWLKNERFDLLLSSPALRVLGTAVMIAEKSAMTPHVVHTLNEQFVGEWEGRTYLEIKKSEPEVYKEWCEDPIRQRPPNGESIVDLYDRVVKELEEIIKQEAGKRIALVTHAGVIRSTIVYALGMPIDNFWRLSVPTGSVSKVDFSNNFATVHYMSFRP